MEVKYLFQYGDKITTGIPHKENFDLKETINEMIIKDNDSFRCKTCGKGDKRLDNMKKHVEIHIDGIAYDCPLCDKTFRSKSSYNNHMYRDKTHKIFH